MERASSHCMPVKEVIAGLLSGQEENSYQNVKFIYMASLTIRTHLMVSRPHITTMVRDPCVVAMF